MATPRVPQIQALRAIAAILVLLYHAKLSAGGYIGVDIFYVISGYLITGLLLAELERSKSLSLSAFYTRRFKRLLPASFLVIAVTGLAGWFVFPASMRHEFGRDLIAASTYISNFLFALWQNDYQNLGSTPSPFIHFWSLAVEEQFYLFWPLILYVAYRKGGRKLVGISIATIAALSFLFSLYLTAREPIWSFYILPTRAWELALGALIIFLPKRNIFPPILSIFALFALLIGAFIFDDATAFPGTAALLPAFATAILLAIVKQRPVVLQQLSSPRIVQWLGEISYPLYLWHWPVLVLPTIYLDRSLNLFERALLLALTALLADLTHRFVEEPFRYIEWNPRKTLKFSSSITAVAVLLGGLIYNSHSDEITFQDGTRYSLTDIRMKPKNNLDGCHIHVGKTVSPKCEYGDVSSKETIVLYGDSHAAQWLPALDIIGRENGIKVVSLTKSACPAAEVIKELSSQYRVKNCQDFRDNSIARIRALKPLAVIMTGMQPFTAPYSEEDARPWWLKGEAIAYSRIKDFVQYPIYLNDTPLPQVNVPDCLSAGKGGACDGAKPVPTQVAKGLIAINPTPWLCDRLCKAVVDGVVAYRDKSHISVAMSEHLAPKLEQALREIGVL